MSDQEHTAEPWKTAYRKSVLGGFGQEVFDADGNTIATMAWYAVEIAPGHTGTNREANARRIVACVNACSGISTEKLEEANDLFKAAAAGGATYKRQRDELLAALESMVSIARLTIGWSCTPANADGPLVVAERLIAQVRAAT